MFLRVFLVQLLYTITHGVLNKIAHAVYQNFRLVLLFLSTRPYYTNDLVQRQIEAYIPIHPLAEIISELVAY